MKTHSEAASKTVMIVDDDADLIMLLTQILDASGIKTVSASTGEGALALLALGPIPDLILTDLCMPGMGGAEFMAKLRDNSKTGSVPVIVSSGYDDVGPRSETMGAQGYLSKPFHLKAVQTMINTHIH